MGEEIQTKEEKIRRLVKISGALQLAEERFVMTMAFAAISPIDAEGGGLLPTMMSFPDAFLKVRELSPVEDLLVAVCDRLFSEEEVDWLLRNFSHPLIQRLYEIAQGTEKFILLPEEERARMRASLQVGVFPRKGSVAPEGRKGE